MMQALYLMRQVNAASAIYANHRMALPPSKLGVALCAQHAMWTNNIQVVCVLLVAQSSVLCANHPPGRPTQMGLLVSLMLALLIAKVSHVSHNVTLLLICFTASWSCCEKVASSTQAMGQGQLHSQ